MVSTYIGLLHWRQHNIQCALGLKMVRRYNTASELVLVWPWPLTPDPDAVVNHCLVANVVHSAVVSLSFRLLFVYDVRVMPWFWRKNMLQVFTETRATRWEPPRHCGERLGFLAAKKTCTICPGLERACLWEWDYGNMLQGNRPEWHVCMHESVNPSCFKPTLLFWVICAPKFK